MADSNDTTPISTTSFIDTLGADTHMAYTDGEYANVTQVISDLKYLGIDTVRDGITNGTDANGNYNGSAPLSTYIEMAQAGIKFTFIIEATSEAYIQSQLALINQVETAVPGSVIGIEGPNEINNQPITFNGISGEAGAQAAQQALYSAVKADPLLAGVPVDYFTGYSSNVDPVAAGLADADTAHPYPNFGEAPAAWVSRSNAFPNANNSATIPGVFTETGYSTGSVNDAVQAKYTMDLLMDTAKEAISQTYLYELMDAYAPGSNQGDAGWGLFDYTTAPKPVATAIHNMTTLLQDTGAQAATFQPTTLNYTIAGLPTSGNSMVMEKSDGTYVIAVWAEPQIWNNDGSLEEVAAPTENVTVTLPQNFNSIQVFDPLSGTNAIASYTNGNSVTVAVTDHPIFIELGSAPSAPITPSTNVDTLVLNMSEDAFDGDAQFRVSVDGNWLNAAVYTVTAVRSGDQSQNFVLTGNFGAGPHTVSIDFLNDLYGGSTTTDRNLYVNSITLDGNTTVENTEQGSTGSENYTVQAPSSPVTITPPTIAITSQVLEQDPLTHVDDGTVTLTGTVSGETGTSVQVLDGTTVLGIANVTDGTWTYTMTVPSGTHTLSAVATDLAGDVVSTAAQPTFNVEPAVPVTIPSTGTDTLSLNISEDAYDGNSQFTISVDGQQIGGIQSATALRDSAQGQNFTLEGNFGAGPHTVSVDFLNDLYAGTPTTDRNLYVNAITLDGSTTFVNSSLLDNGTSNFTVQTPSTPAASNVGTNDTLTLNMSEVAASGIDAQFMVSVDGQLVGSVQSVTALQSAGQTQDITLTGDFGSGSHTIGIDFLNGFTGAAQDIGRTVIVNSITLDGNTVTENGSQEYDGVVNYTVEAGTTTTTPPPPPPTRIAPVVTEASSPSASASSTATLGTAAAGNSGDALTVKLLSDANFTSGSSLTLTNGNLIYTPGTITSANAGANTIKYSVTDTTNGLVTTETQNVTLVAPAVVKPIISITGQVLAKDTGTSSTDDLTNDGAVTLSGTVTGATGTIVQIMDGTIVLGNATINNGTWTYATTLSAGTHNLSAVATDPSGNKATSSTEPTITVDTTNPTLIITAPTQAANTTNLTLTGTVSDGLATTVQIMDGSTVLGNATVTNGTWTYGDNNASTGSHTFSASATDAAGNTTTATDAAFTVVAPVTPPPTKTIGYNTGTFSSTTTRTVSDTTAETIASTGSTTIALNISEDAYLGDAQFTVSVDGVQVGGIETATALHDDGQDQIFTLQNNLSAGQHTVSVDFLNDAVTFYTDGTLVGDRNLYVNSITVDGTSTTTENSYQNLTGTVNYAITVPTATTPPPVMTPPPVQVAPVVAEAASPSASATSTATLGTAVAGNSGDALTVKLLSDADFTSGSSLTLTNGNLIYTPGTITSSNAGTETLTYSVTDTTNGLITTETQNVTLVAPPVVTPPAGSTTLVTIPSTGSDTLVVNMAGIASTANGIDPEFTISVNGVQIGGIQTVTALRDSAQSQDFTLYGNFGTGPVDVAITYINGFTGSDAQIGRTLYVNSLTLNGETTFANTPPLLFDSTTDYSLQKPATPISNAGTADTLTLNMSETAVNGQDVQFMVSVDGQLGGGVETLTASQAAGQSQNITLTGDFGSGTHAVAVDMLNGFSGNPATIGLTLDVNSITLDGNTTVENASQTYLGSQNYTVQSGTSTTVTPPPPVQVAPVVTEASSPSASASSTATLGTAVAGNSGDALTVKLLSDADFASGSSLTLSNGSLIYTPGTITSSNAGTDTLTYSVTDTTNSTSVTETENVTLVAPVVVKPTVSIRSQTLTKDTGTSATDDLTNDGAVTLSGTVTGASGTVIQIIDGSTVLDNATITNGTWTYNTTLTSGTHSLSAIATDPSGNKATSSTEPTITVDTTDPTLTITTPTQATNTTNLTLTGTVSDSLATTVKIKDGSTILGNATVSNGTWTYSDSNASTGSHTFSAIATDAAGNTTTATDAAFTVAAPVTTAPVTTSAVEVTPEIVTASVAVNNQVVSTQVDIHSVASGTLVPVSTSGPGTNPLVTFNWDPATQLANFIAAEKSSSTSGSPVNIVSLGDTSSVGAGATSNGSYDLSYTVEMARALSADGLTADSDNFLGGYIGTNSNETLIGPGKYSGLSAAGGNLAGGEYPGGVLTYDLGANKNYNRVNIDYADFGDATISVSMGNTVIGTFTVGNTGAMKTETLDLPAGVTDDTITISSTDYSNPFTYIEGVSFWNSADPGTDVYNAAVGGATSNSVNDTSNFPGLGEMNGVIALSPALAIIDYGMDDMMNGLTTAQTVANITKMITELRAAGSDVIVVIPQPFSGSDYSDDIANLRAGLETMATQLNVPVIDLSATYGDNINNLLNAGLANNGISYDATLQADIGSAIAQLLANGVTDPSAAPPASTDPVSVTITSQTLQKDSGISATDNITNDGVVALAGTLIGAAGTSVTIMDGNNTLGTATVASNGTWTFSTTLTAGSHALQAVATDTSGNTATSLLQSAITVETAPPVITIATPTATATNGVIDLAATGTISAAPGTTVEIFNGSTDLGAATLDGQGNWSFHTALPTGTYTLEAVATDQAGNVADATAAPVSATATPIVSSSAPATTTSITMADPTEAQLLASSLVVYNWDPATQLANFLAAEAAVTNGTVTTPVSIVAMGDSTTAGVGSTSAANYENTAYPVDLTSDLTQDGITSQNDNFLGGYTGLDNRVTMVGNAAYCGIADAGGNVIALSAASDAVDFTLNTPTNYDRVTISYLDIGGGSLTVSVDGGVPLATIQVGVSGNDMTQTIDIPAGLVSEVTVSGADGKQTFVDGVSLWNSNDPGTVVYNAGVAGTTTSFADTSILGDGIAGTGTTQGYGDLPGVAALNPSLVLINYGINDLRTIDLSDPTTVTAAITQAVANLAQTVAALRAQGTDAILVIPQPWGDDTLAEAAMDQFRTAMEALSTSQNIPLIDLSATYGYNVTPLLQAGLTADGIHPDSTLYANIASKIAGLLSGAIDSSTTSIIPVSDTQSVSANNATIAGTATVNTLIGTGTNDTYVMSATDQSDTIINGSSANTAATNILDVNAANHNQLWLEQSGNNLVIDVLGTNQQTVVQNWFSSSSAQLQEIVGSDNYKLTTANVQNLVQAMASFSAANPAFNPVSTTSTNLTNSAFGTTLTTAVSNAWHA